MSNDMNFALSRNQDIYVLANFPLSDSIEKTDVEKRLERVNRRLKVTKKHLAGYTGRSDEARKELEKAESAFKLAKNNYDYVASRNNMYIRWHQRKIDELTKEQAVYRLMNDIRLGKILPVVAETGNIANVTFS